MINTVNVSSVEDTVRSIISIIAAWYSIVDKSKPSSVLYVFYGAKVSTKSAT